MSSDVACSTSTYTLAPSLREIIPEEPRFDRWVLRGLGMQW